MKNNSLNLLKIVSMFLIIIWHCIIHGNILGNVDNHILNQIINIILFLIIIHVNCFVLITGYFQHQSTFKIKKVVNLMISVIFYSLLFNILHQMYTNESITITGIVENLLPSVLSKYWFVLCYIILYLFSDYLNIIISKISKKDYDKGLITIFTIYSIIPFLFGERFISNNGYTVIQFILLYFIGAYLFKYPLRQSKLFKNKSNKTYIIYQIIIMFSMFLINYSINIFADYYINNPNYLGKIANTLMQTKYSYARPFVLIQSVAVFEIFNQIKLKKNIFNKITPYIFGIYLITENEYIRPIIYKPLMPASGKITSYNFLLELIGYSLLIFIICILIEYIRKQIFKIFHTIKKKC